MHAKLLKSTGPANRLNIGCQLAATLLQKWISAMPPVWGRPPRQPGSVLSTDLKDHETPINISRLTLQRMNLIVYLTLT
jgi:hypothetical protein